MIDDRTVHVPRVAEVVAGDLRRRIVNGELGAGDTLPREAELVAQYGVSRPTLREAIRILESQALIAVQRGSRSGALVQTPDIRVAALHTAIRLQIDRTPLSDLFAARVEIGVAAVRRVAAQQARSDLEELGRLHRHELELDRASPEFPSAVTAFHAAMVEAGGNNTMTVVRQILERIVLNHESRVPDVEQQRIRAVYTHDLDAHQEVIRAIEAGDVEAAEHVWRPHLEQAAAEVLAVLGGDTVVDLLGLDGPAVR